MNSRTRRTLAWALTLAAVGACRGEEQVEVASSDLLSLDADMALVKMEHFMTRDGLRRAHLLADTAYFLQDSSKVRMRPVAVTFFDSDGQEVSELTAAEGIYDMRTNDMRVTGGVVVLSRRDFQRLETERLTYSAKDDKLRSDTLFVLYQNNTVLRGTGLVSDPGLRETTVTHPSAVIENPRAPGGKR